MTNPNPSSGGMPKWLIILLVILLVMILGCCGGITTCFFLARRAARSAIPAFQQAQQRMIEEAQRAQEDAIKAQQQQAAPNGAAPAANATAAPADGGTGGAGATPGAASSGMMSMSKMPKNFPTDVPILDGLTVISATSDNIANKGVVVLKGNVKADDVVTYYTPALEKTGYTQTTNTSTNDITQLAFTKGDLQVSVQILPGDSGAATSSNVIITYGPK